MISSQNVIPWMSEAVYSDKLVSTLDALSGRSEQRTSGGDRRPDGRSIRPSRASVGLGGGRAQPKALCFEALIEGVSKLIEGLHAVAVERRAVHQAQSTWTKVGQ